jgi:hypothetical protein
MIVLDCHKGIGPAVRGTALVARDNFSARYDLDRINGVFSRPQHALAWMLHEMKARGVVPLALLFNAANTILAQGAALADLALCDRFAAGDVTELIRTGDELLVEPAAGRVTILSRDA